MDQEQAKFEGWAVVELMGHQREVGFVTTQYFGGPALFQIDVPELPERETTLKRPDWIDGRHAPAGTVVKRDAVQGRTRLVSPSAIYALNPCSEEVARRELDRMPCSIKIVSLPENAQLPEPSENAYDEEEDELGDEF